jgi:beta-glucosidase
LPDDFVWGLASSAYQVEGAAQDEGKGPSIWDLIAHRQANAVADNSTGDVVASFYYLYKQDFARLANLGVPYFSPSFSWYALSVMVDIVLEHFADLGTGHDFSRLATAQ